jgi:hypothetical protein
MIYKFLVESIFLNNSIKLKSFFIIFLKTYLIQNNNNNGK